jgi:hypothetical protein
MKHGHENHDRLLFSFLFGGESISLCAFRRRTSIHWKWIKEEELAGSGHRNWCLIGEVMRAL